MHKEATMKKLAILCSVVPTLAMADIDSQFGLGLGTQYGGFAGIKYSANLDSNKFYVGAGFSKPPHDNDEYGVTLGWERALTDKQAVGFAARTRKLSTGGGNYIIGSYPDDFTTVVGKDGYESFIAATYTYYFTKPTESGFLTGLSAGKTYRKNNVVSEFRSGMEYGVYFGYQF